MVWRTSYEQGVEKKKLINSLIEIKYIRIRIMFTKKHRLSTDLSTIIPQKRSIIVIIVHFGSAESTEKLVHAIINGLRPPDQILIVDHDPIPYKNDNKRIVCIRPAENRGYIAGLRIGVRTSIATEESLLVLLNNDIAVTDHFLTTIESWWKKSGGPLILAGPHIALLSRFTGRAFVELRHSFHILFPLEYMDGACMVLQRSLFDQISDFEHLFMYWEDIAMSLRAAALGGKLKKIPHLQVMHDNRQRKLSGQKLYCLVRNGAYILEQLPFPWGAYWAVKNRIRLWFHTLLPGERHVCVAQALKHAQTLL